MAKDNLDDGDSIISGRDSSWFFLPEDGRQSVVGCIILFCRFLLSSSLIRSRCKIKNQNDHTTTTINIAMAKQRQEFLSSFMFYLIIGRKDKMSNFGVFGRVSNLLLVTGIICHNGSWGRPWKFSHIHEQRLRLEIQFQIKENGAKKSCLLSNPTNMNIRLELCLGKEE